MVARAFERDSLFALIAGPLVWTAHFDDEILGVRVVQLFGGAVSVVAVALILDAMMLAYRRWRGMPWDGQPGPLPPHDKNDVASRRRFMAYAGLLLSGLALVATIWETLPIVFFAACH
jgi:hypothetical protein